LQADASQFEAIAKKYGQTGEKQWITTAQYQNAPSMDVNTKSYINALNNGAVNQIQNLKLDQANVILQVVDRKAMISKYTAAVIKKTVDFSKDTYSAAYNKFASFVSANQNSEDLLKNAAKNGYKVLEANDVTTSSHYLANIHSTRDALKWLFEAKKGEISPLYECGDNDHLLVAVCSEIHPIGYRSLDDAQVKEMIKAEVLRDKKAEQLMAKLQGVSSIAAAKAKGAQITTVDQITFAAPVFVAAAGASEPALSGAVYATAKGKFSSKPVKGNAGVYAFQVLNKKNRPGKFDAKTMEAKCRQKAMQYAGNFMSELYQKAKVVDNRYLFF
jgi:peptidyl-prolyl cis-trans isomerase D